MSDVVYRLRQASASGCSCPSCSVQHEAADEIDRLRAGQVSSEMQAVLDAADEWEAIRNIP